MKRARATAFSLVETLIALGLLASCGLVILALLLGGVQQTETVRNDTMALLLARQVRTRLLDPQWPSQRQGPDGAWNAQVFFDINGAPVEEKTAAAFRVEMTAGPGLGFDNPRLEAVRARVLQQASNLEIDSFVLQRLTEAGR